MQQGVRWFKGPAGEAFRFQCGAQGIHIPSLAARVQLRDRPLEVNGVVVDFDQQTGYMSLEEAAGIIGELGLSAQNPIQVSGQPADRGSTPPAPGAGARCIPGLPGVSSGTSASSASKQQCVSNTRICSASKQRVSASPAPVVLASSSVSASPTPVLLASSNVLASPAPVPPASNIVSASPAPVLLANSSVSASPPSAACMSQQQQHQQQANS